jgi:hypothetical protein
VNYGALSDNSRKNQVVGLKFNGRAFESEKYFQVVLPIVLTEPRCRRKAFKSGAAAEYSLVSLTFLLAFDDWPEISE